MREVKKIAPESLRIEIGVGVATVTLNRPHILNALDEQMIDAFRTALRELATDPSVRVLVLTGAGRAFCAGMSLRDDRLLAESPPVDLGERMATHYNPLVLDILKFPKPTLCAVNGVAAGGGVSLALACDIVVAAEEASFVQVFAAIGLIPDLGGTWFLPHFVGLARARALALLGDPLTATQAAESGMIWKALPSAHLIAESAAIAAKLASLPTATAIATREILAASYRNDAKQQLIKERELQRHLGSSTEFRLRIRKFLASRKSG